MGHIKSSWKRFTNEESEEQKYISRSIDDNMNQIQYIETNSEMDLVEKKEMSRTLL